MRFIRHITLTTGDVRDSPAGEVSPDAIEACAAQLAQAIETRESVPMPAPALAEYHLSAMAHGRRAAMCWVHRGEALVASIGIALTSRAGARLWRLMHEDATVYATDPERPPSAPWVAAALHPGAELYMDAMEWLGDYERCLAWAWVQIREAGRRVH